MSNPKNPEDSVILGNIRKSVGVTTKGWDPRVIFEIYRCYDSRIGVRNLDLETNTPPES